MMLNYAKPLTVGPPRNYLLFAKRARTRVLNMIFAKATVSHCAEKQQRERLLEIGGGLWHLTAHLRDVQETLTVKFNFNEFPRRAIFMLTKWCRSVSLRESKRHQLKCDFEGIIRETKEWCSRKQRPRLWQTLTHVLISNAEIHKKSDNEILIHAAFL